MRLTIFWRIILAQASLVALTIVINIYAVSQLQSLTHLSQGILSTDAAAMEEAKRLLRLMFTQRRSVEKFVLLQDKAFYDQFLETTMTFAAGLDKLMELAPGLAEQEILRRVRDLHALYAASLEPPTSRKSMAAADRAEVSERMTTSMLEFIRLREEAVAQKTATARDQAALAARTVTWLTCGGIGLAVLFAYLHARSIARPLKDLAHELRMVGRGEFQRYVDIRSPEEVGELSRAFNWMATRLAKLDELKEDFIAHISHELRTPLSAMREGLSLLWEEIPGPLTTSQRDVVNVLRSHGERLYQFLSSVLDLAKMEAGMMEYLPVPCDLAILLERSLQSVQLMARRKGIRLEVLCPTALPVLLLDETRMQQVLDNLLNNATKFTPEGGFVRVAVALREQQGDRGANPWLELRVADTGGGIPSEEIERIFRKFYQSPRPQNQQEHGSGLGLAIARHIVAAHDGKLWVESQLGQGSTFILLLPVQRDEPEATTQAQVAMAAGATVAPWRNGEDHDA